MKLEKNKKGSHVGMVLSFTLFITFLIFIYQIIMPSVKTFDDDYEILESFKNRVIENVSDQVYVLRVQEGPVSGAPVLIDITSLNIGTSKEVIAFDSQGNEIPAAYNSPVTIAMEEDHGDMILYLHEEFVETQPATPAGGPQSTIENVLVEERILETKIIELIGLMETDYTLVRETFDLVGDYEFDIGFKYQNGTWINSGINANPKTNIYSKQFSVNYLTVHAKEEIGEIVVKIW